MSSLGNRSQDGGEPPCRVGITGPERRADGRAQENQRPPPAASLERYRETVDPRDPLPGLRAERNHPAEVAEFGGVGPEEVDVRRLTRPESQRRFDGDPEI